MSEETIINEWRELNPRIRGSRPKQGRKIDLTLYVQLQSVFLALEASNSPEREMFLKLVEIYKVSPTKAIALLNTIIGSYTKNWDEQELKERMQKAFANGLTENQTLYL
jgi:hypothetical protein